MEQGSQREMSRVQMTWSWNASPTDPSLLHSSQSPSPILPWQPFPRKLSKSAQQSTSKIFKKMRSSLDRNKEYRVDALCHSIQVSLRLAPTRGLIDFNDLNDFAYRQWASYLLA